jgi:hypothetical protein
MDVYERRMDTHVWVGFGVRVWFEMLTLRDAKALKRWWNDHTISYFHILPSEHDRRFYRLMKGSEKIFI